MTDVGEKANARVIFEIEVIDGWPPVSSERLWAFSLGDDIYRIDNAPWFVRDLAIGDLVEARASAPNEHPVFQRIV
ncbi:DUF4265 domain-containing protein, partial [Jatrophihabitans sp.]|uniref:DUF4265 domain-containing protein n=1 Tax=Jatrophihabitans sp. TaxID=1932789 RepID=UPI0030C6C85D|nr:hypothetical protein [Jatrophihabitans sp.]